MKGLRILTGLVFCLYLSWAIPARADVVADWNAIATQTSVPVRPGPSAILDMAIVHAAMHDAIQAFEGRFQSYSGSIPNASGSPVAAAATAAHDVLFGTWHERLHPLPAARALLKWCWEAGLTVGLDGRSPG